MMTGKAASFVALTWRERWLLAQAAVMLPVMAALLRVVPFRRLGAMVDKPAREAAMPDRMPAARIAHMVAAAGAYGPYRATCVPQSLVLQWLLRRNGMRGELRYGVRKIDGQVSAHCWIEFDGEPLIDSPEVRRQFALLEPSPASAPWRR